MQSTITWIDASVTKPEPHNFPGGLVYLVILRQKDGKYYDPAEATWQFYSHRFGQEAVGSWTTVDINQYDAYDDLEEGGNVVAYWAELPGLPRELVIDV